MTTRPVSMGPRIYNLFPLLCGRIIDWQSLLPWIDDMGFDWVYLNPFHYPGFSGSLYAVKDYYRLNPLFRDQSGRDDATLLAEFTGAARDRGLKIMMDLVVNHTAKDSLLAEQHPDWFARERDGSIRSPFAVDPADTRKKTVWGDLGEIDYDNAAILPALADYWTGVVRHYIQRGFVGFRCDAAYKVPADIWRRIIADARRTDSNVRFFAETLGCRLEQIERLADAGFDYLFNSVKWWDLEAPWALEQYEMFRHIAPSIAFPESHDTERLANELPADLPRPDDTRKWLELRYALAACFSTGVLMPVGYEYGFRRRLDVVRTRPADWEKPQFDLSHEIAAINRMKAACPALNEEGPQVRLAGATPALLRRTADGAAMSIFVANPSPRRSAWVELGPALRAAAVPAGAFVDETPGRAPCQDALTFELSPLDWRLLRTG